MSSDEAEANDPVSSMAPARPKLVQLIASPPQRQELMKESAGLPSLQLTPQDAAHLAMLACGAYSPLDRFMGSRECENVARHMRLLSGEIFPVPIVLPAGPLKSLNLGTRLALRDVQNRLLAIMTVEEVFDTPRAALAPAGPRAAASADARVALVQCLSGPLQALHLPADPQLPHMWKDPATIAEQLSLMGRESVVAVETWDWRDSRQTAWLRELAAERDASLLVNLAAADPRADDFDQFHRLLACKAAFSQHFSAAEAFLNFVHLAPSLSTERQILWHALVHRNYGAGAFVVDATRCSRASSTSSDSPFKPSPWLLDAAAELGVELVVYRGERSALREVHEVSDAPGRAPRRAHGPAPVLLGHPEAPPSQPELSVLSPWGLCIWFTGLPSSGKSAIAEELLILLMESGLRVTVLDGDTVRTHLSKGLGFSREDRDTNVHRIGFVASEIVRHRGVVICAAVSPYRETRNEVRARMPEGSFIEVFVDTPIEVCEQRDVKGYYAKARAGQVAHFTGIDDPYEPPLDAELVLHTEDTTVHANATRLMRYLVDGGYLGAEEFEERRPLLKAAGHAARAGR
jgi:sulfate adenylyltransferase